MKIPSSLRWKPNGRTLGQGGQAPVIEVTDCEDEFKRVYALKALSSGKPAKAYERFSREIEAIRTLTHPSIIRIIDHSAPGRKFPYYVMELIEGAVPLKKLLGTENNPFRKSPEKALEIFLGLLSGVEACEKVDIVHRDLSPANILVLPNSSIKIIDFELCQFDDVETIALTDEGVGRVER